MLDGIQLVAMVLLPLQWRGLGEYVLLGKQGEQGGVNA